MADLLALDLVDKQLVTDRLVLTVGYDIENLTDPQRAGYYKGPVTTDPYGRRIPKHAHGTAKLEQYTNSARQITAAVMELFEQVVDRNLLVRRLNLTAGNVIAEQAAAAAAEATPEQLDLFTDYAARQAQQKQQQEDQDKEKRRQQAVLAIKKKYGKNAILKGMNLQEGATTKDRNEQIGGHKA